MPVSRSFKRVLLILASLLFLSSGTLHFLRTGAFVRIVPPYLPSPRLLVYISGAAEIAGAVGLLLPRTRRLAAWGLVALLLAVFPANLYMATNSVQVSATPVPQYLLWARLPLQFLLIWWILWASSSKNQQQRGQ